MCIKNKSDLSTKAFDHSKQFFVLDFEDSETSSTSTS